jgi:DNA-binding transcriptional regulator YbjK
MGRQSKASQRREQIIWALYECLAEKGHEKVTIKSIAGRAGLPYGVIHYYFKSKDEIVSSLAQAVVEKYSNLLESRLASAESKAREIELSLDFIVDELIFDMSLNRVIKNLIQMAFEREGLHQVMKNMFQVYRERITLVLSEAGIGDESRVLGSALVAMAEGFSVQWMVDPSAFNRVEVRRLMAQYLSERLRGKTKQHI